MRRHVAGYRGWIGVGFVFLSSTIRTCVSRTRTIDEPVNPSVVRPFRVSACCRARCDGRLLCCAARHPVKIIIGRRQSVCARRTVHRVGVTARCDTSPYSVVVLSTRRETGFIYVYFFAFPKTTAQPSTMADVNACATPARRVYDCDAFLFDYYFLLQTFWSGSRKRSPPPPSTVVRCSFNGTFAFRD